MVPSEEEEVMRWNLTPSFARNKRDMPKSLKQKENTEKEQEKKKPNKGGKEQKKMK